MSPERARWQTKRLAKSISSYALIVVQPGHKGKDKNARVEKRTVLYRVDRGRRTERGGRRAAFEIDLGFPGWNGEG